MRQYTTMMSIQNTKAIQYLNTALRLPASGHEQDWEIELADANRLNEFVSFYENNELPEEVNVALMSLIVASLDEFMSDGRNDKTLLEKIKNLLKSDSNLHSETIKYWSLLQYEDQCDSFEVTKFIRSL